MLGSQPPPPAAASASGMSREDGVSGSRSRSRSTSTSGETAAAVPTSGDATPVFSDERLPNRSGGSPSDQALYDTHTHTKKERDKISKASNTTAAGAMRGRGVLTFSGHLADRLLTMHDRGDVLL